MLGTSFISCIDAYSVFACFFLLQKADVLKYTDEEYEKYLTDPVGTSCNNKFL